jgi:hypothetical protein
MPSLTPVLEILPAVEQFRNDAMTELTTTIDEMRASSAKRAELHKKMLRDLPTKGVVNSLPGDPVFCPALQALAHELPQERLQVVENSMEA